MLTDLLKQIRNEPEVFKKGIKAKGREEKIIDEILNYDKEYRALLAEIEFLRAELNNLSREKKFDQDHLEKARGTKERIKELEKQLEPIENKLENLLYQIPNLPLADVPVGKDETENVVLREVGKKPDFKFEPKDYLTLVEDKWIDVKRAAKFRARVLAI
jgi:Seryl-tRNA synthetase